MFKINPYYPGAGRMPSYLSGRDDIISSVSEMFDYMANGIPGQSIIFTGLRGVGKTVLINKLFSIAEKKGIYCKHIEVERKNDFTNQINTCIKTYLQQHSSKEKIRNIFTKAVNTLKSFQISFCPDDNSFSVAMQDDFLYKSNSLSQSMTDLFCSVGEIANETNSPICIFIDEMQCMNKKELSSLISAIHRANQLGYLIIIIAAGLPKLYSMLSDEKSYSERLFYYEEIGSLTYDQTRSAIIEPVCKMGISYTNDAIEEIYNTTKGYPFFIQQYCNVVFKNTIQQIITELEVKEMKKEFFTLLDKGFFKVRYEKCTQSEKNFIFAMVKCSKLPCTISNVAKNLNKQVNSVSTTRAQLINKGIIYPVKYKELDFTVPEFDGYIHRLEEYTDWCSEI